MRDDATERPYAAHCQHGVSVKSCGTCYAKKEAAGSPADGPGEDLMPSISGFEAFRVAVGSPSESPYGELVRTAYVQDAVPEATRAEVQRMHPKLRP